MTYQEQARQLKEKLAEQKKIFDAQDQRAVEAKKLGQSDEEAYKAAEPSADESTQAKKLGEEIEELYQKAADLKEREDARNTNGSRLKELSQPVGRPDYANTDSRNIQEGFKSRGREFTESQEFKDWFANIAPHGGSIANGLKIESPAVEAKSLVYTTATSGGALVRRDYAPMVDLPLRPLTIRDVISNGRTGSNLVEYVRITAKTRAAAVVPEATATSSTGYSNAAKPESGMTLAIIQEGVKTIAVWMPITRQILADAPQLESVIDNFERDDLELALEEQIISGTGGSNFTGLENTVGLTPQAFTTDMLTTTRKARTAAMITGRARSTAYLLNPYDWESLDLTKDAENRYYFGGPLSMGTKMLWGLPVVESEVIPQGTGYTGDLRQLMLWDREQATRRITDSHSDFFTHNLLAILTEMRAAFGVIRPAAVVKIDLFAGANS
jgi:HK97 family phage major capsid protein